MPTFLSFFASRRGIVSAGIFIGIFAALLQKMGNPGNMGICVACFERDIAGALGLHRAAVVQYMRPEIIGFVLGMIVGAGISHNFGLASSPDGVGPYGIPAVIIGLLACLFIGFTMREKMA